MNAVIWDYEVDIMQMSYEKKQEYCKEYDKKWRKANPERKREYVRKSSKTFYYRHRNNEEYMEERRQIARDWHKRKMTESTAEELEEYRRKNREKQKRFKARQRAKKKQGE